MQISAKDLERIFRRLGIEPKRSTHHVAGYLVVGGRRVLAVHYSNGRKDMPAPVAELFRKSLHLDPAEFQRLHKGDMSRDQYLQILLPRLGLPAATEP